MDDQGVVDDCTMALSLKKNADTYYQRGISRYILKQYNEAIQDFNESLKLKPGYELATLERGITYYTLAKDELALVDLNNAVKINPKNSRAYYYRGLLKKYSNDLAGSCKDLKEADALGAKGAKEELTKNGCK